VRPLTRLGRRRRTAPGVNVVGYLDASSGLGERARELAACLRAAGVDVTEWSVPDTAEGREPASVIRRSTIAIVTAVQLASVRERLPTPFERADHTVGYFFWELADVPDEQQWGIGLVDEIWTPTEFVRAAYAGATDRPVRLVPIPIPRPTVAAVASPNDRPFTFLTSFDHRSVMARKHPIGVVDAFRRAFPAGDEPVALVVKSMHGDERPVAVERLRAAVGTDPRITLRDELVDTAAQHQLVADADAFVSLHRSEGLGLHLAEAMWLGTPVIATGYSGNLDLMDDTCAALVDHRLVDVSDGDGAYPETSRWAEPDLDHAAALMRRMATDEPWRHGLAAAARARMAAQPSRAAAGSAISRLLARPA